MTYVARDAARDWVTVIYGARAEFGRNAGDQFRGGAEAYNANASVDIGHRIARHKRHAAARLEGRMHAGILLLAACTPDEEKGYRVVWEPINGSFSTRVFIRQANPTVKSCWARWNIFV